MVAKAPDTGRALSQEPPIPLRWFDIADIILTACLIAGPFVFVIFAVDRLYPGTPPPGLAALVLGALALSGWLGWHGFWAWRRVFAEHEGHPRGPH